MKPLLKILKLIFYPLKIVVDILYGTKKPAIVGYSWYSKVEYEKMLKTAQDAEMILPYDEWKVNAEETVVALRNRGLYIIKVNVKTNELNKWLRHQKLTNLHENRMLFMGNKVAKFTEDPFI